MNTLDLILTVILLVFTLAGFLIGFVRTVGFLISIIAGAILAANYFYIAFDWLVSHNTINLDENWLRTISFVLVFLAAVIIIQFIFWIIDRFFRLPFLKSINRLAGLVFGLIEGGVLLSIALIFVVKFPFASFLLPMMETSKVAQFLVELGTKLMPLLPDIFNEVKEIIKL